MELAGDTLLTSLSVSFLFCIPHRDFFCFFFCSTVPTRFTCLPDLVHDLFADAACAIVCTYFHMLLCLKFGVLFFFLLFLFFFGGGGFFFLFLVRGFHRLGSICPSFGGTIGYTLLSLEGGGQYMSRSARLLTVCQKKKEKGNHCAKLQAQDVCG
ncbi:hypothetical protein Tb11.03.0320 [Trypanosoma brucei brucei TREU927]|uniref:T. brucei spp.-specific protein n=1 Tax=Trypanosoma brucei brucei (strain 927/4 GUTat10.1) TaxID=185431 RepID=Q387G8_TRYB2|nr:hypothetical protein Tb11.03.0320 [Trypanosoma brucei brucei TREU927]EAN79063.1 hypothetical protein Tb11.03.0320 [Trypanosoma brucei brucei TREU927]